MFPDILHTQTKPHLLNCVQFYKHITEGIQVTNKHREYLADIQYSINITARLLNYTLFTDFTSATSSNVAEGDTSRQTLANNSISHLKKKKKKKIQFNLSYK